MIALLAAVAAMCLGFVVLAPVADHLPEWAVFGFLGLDVPEDES